MIQSDGTKKYLLFSKTEASVESVLIPEEGRATLCILLRSVAPWDAAFCLTALLSCNGTFGAPKLSFRYAQSRDRRILRI
jgi:adenine C2-methylase RlmN of 23S rRNA A2503 and tRNA A37